jgi:hypothetical protein
MKKQRQLSQSQHSKQRRARVRSEKRALSFRRGKKPAAPAFPGHPVPFLESPRRCEFCVWFWLTRVLHFSPLVAARIATAFVDRRSLITAIEETRNGVRYEGLQARYQGGADNSPDGNTLKDRVNYFLRNAEATLARLGKADLLWLGQSTIALTRLYEAAGTGDAGKIEELVNSLAKDGWDHVLIRRAFSLTITKPF